MTLNLQQQNFLAKLVPGAQAAMQQYGVPASITLAQGIFESATEKGWGTSPLALQANNYFGIKAENKADPSSYIEFPTHEYINGKYTLVMDDFQKYKGPSDSCMDHARLLAKAPRYAPAMRSLPNIVEFANQLHACGYSTTPDYGTRLMSAINFYNLKQYDSVSAKTA